MNKNKTCLRVIDPKKPPPSPKPAVLTQNECDLSKVYPAFNGVRNIWLNGTLKQLQNLSSKQSLFGFSVS